MNIITNLIQIWYSLLILYCSDGYSPAVRSLLELYAIDGSKIVGTGKQGKILKGDVLKHVTENNLSIKPPRTG